LKVLFYIPAIRREKQWGRWHKGAGNNSFNYGIASLAGYLIDKGIDVALIDGQFYPDDDSLASAIRSQDPDLVGISCYTPTYVEAIKAAWFCKTVLRDVKIVMGGAHPSLYPEETLTENPYVDFVVVGEGEQTLHELCEALSLRGDLAAIRGLGHRTKEGVAVNERRAFIPNLDDLPIPAYDIFPLDRYQVQVTSYKRLPTLTMVTSRGCPYSCTFCQVKQLLGTRMRYKSPGRLIEEIIYLKKHYNARGLMFQDSTFTFDWDWMREFCGLMISEELDMTWMCFTRADRVNEEILDLMKHAGCYGMSYGVESANQKSLDFMKKNMKIEKIVESVELSIKKGFFVTGTYILGLPGENEKDVLNTIELAKRLATHIAHFYLPIPYPKSDFYYQCEEAGGLRKDLAWEDFNMFDDARPVYVNPDIGLEKMLELKSRAVRAYYRNPKVIYRNLRCIESVEDIKKYYTAAKALLGFYRSK
jgi:radical SAM superfamily enzyme YgiQ (UPF0313 family)